MSSERISIRQFIESKRGVNVNEKDLCSALGILDEPRMIKRDWYKLARRIDERKSAQYHEAIHVLTGARG